MGVAVNVDCVPEQMDVDGVAMVTDGATVDPTLMVIEFEYTGPWMAQLSDDCMVSRTTSPFFNDEF